MTRTESLSVVALLTAIVWSNVGAVEGPDSSRGAVYHNQFAVHIPDGALTADEISEKHGFTNLGQVSTLVLVAMVSQSHNRNLMKSRRVGGRAVTSLFVCKPNMTVLPRGTKNLKVFSWLKLFILTSYHYSFFTRRQMTPFYIK